tara:strand:+ start:278 stop:1702 length:1425 start_codon:yes stop_codon:yes gene_type:complete
MIGVKMYTTILTLYRSGMKIRKISRTTSIHRDTVRKIIKRYEKEKIEEPAIYKRESQIAKWHEEIVGLLSQNLSVVRAYEELKQKGLECSYSTLSHYVRNHKIKNNSCIRLHADPGEEAQVDFGDVGRRYDTKGKLRKAYVFNMRLGYSRYDYWEIVFDQKVETWINCHVKAFRYFCGVPKVIKLDNLKAGVTKVDIYEPLYQKEYKSMADHYGSMLSACSPYKPQEKGKVESGIKYVKNNFFAGREFKNNEDMNCQLRKWQEKANDRVHGTTKEKPVEMYLNKEKEAMLVLPNAEYNISSWHRRRVGKDCHVIIDNNYYSVPVKYVGDDVYISLNYKLLKIYNIENEMIATHERSKSKGVFSTNAAHYDKYKVLCPGFEQHDELYEDKMRKIGDNSYAFYLEIKDKHKRDWYRAVKGIINLRKTYSDEIIDLACKRALHFGIYSYSRIKKILENNCYNLPLTDYIGGEYATYH